MKPMEVAALEEADMDIPTFTTLRTVRKLIAEVRGAVQAKATDSDHQAEYSEDQLVHSEDQAEDLAVDRLVKANKLAN